MSHEITKEEPQEEEDVEYGIRNPTKKAKRKSNTKICQTNHKTP